MPGVSKEFTDLVDALRDKGNVTVAVGDRTVDSTRFLLKEAANRAKVRISMKTFKNPEHVIRARVLNSEDDEKQYTRDTIFRAVNHIRSEIEVLDSGAIDTSEIDEDIEDLKDIANSLEEYARELFSTQ